MYTIDQKEEILSKMLRVRMSQLIVNEMYRAGAFKVPIHLALGHEAIAVAVDRIAQEYDQIVLNHRNIHYNLMRMSSLKAGIDEYSLKTEGLAEGQLGSMNLTNEEKGIVYTSNILGNNLAVAAGFGIAKKVKNEQGVVFVVTGDGAIEEGAFYESLIFEKSHELPVVIIVENNQWSLATKIEERRCPIDLRKLTESLAIPFEEFFSNDVYEYTERLRVLKARALAEKTPVCVEVMLSSLGWWSEKTEQFPDGKFINYHSGPSPAIGRQNTPYLLFSKDDPVFVLEKYLKRDLIEKMGEDILADLRKELA